MGRIDSPSVIIEHLTQLSGLDRHCQSELPKDFYDQIAHHWFNNIAISKTEEYGVTAWKRLGARGIVGQLSGMFYRWERLNHNGRDLADPSMFNAVVDTFGYSMLFHCVFQQTPTFFANPVYHPSDDHEWLLSMFWFGNAGNPPYEHLVKQGLRRSLRMAWNMWRIAK